jgi:hypothetical protein
MAYPHFLAAFLEAHNLKSVDDEIADLQCHNVGNLVVTSGKLLACDPYYCSEVEPFEAVPIPPGQYPVILTVACLRNGPSVQKYHACTLGNRVTSTVIVELM